MSNESEIAKLIGQLSSDQQQELLASLDRIANKGQPKIITDEVIGQEEVAQPKKQKFRRKKNKKEQAQSNSPPPTRMESSPEFFKPQNNNAKGGYENLETGKRPNLFEKSDAFNAAQADSKFDKKVWKNLSPTERRGRARQVSVKCNKCSKEYQVAPNLVFRGDDGQPSFTCDRCLGNIARGRR